MCVSLSIYIHIIQLQYNISNCYRVGAVPKLEALLAESAQGLQDHPEPDMGIRMCLIQAVDVI